jgi:N-methylhydantoinase B/oxoprolinase/acetone carboxylase alpha subunit
VNILAKTPQRKAVRGHRKPSEARLAACLLIVLVITGCGRSRIAELEAQVAELQETLDTVRSDLEDVEAQVTVVNEAVAQLDSTVDQFGYQDWRIVVRNVQSDATELQIQAQELESLVDTAISNTDYVSEGPAW